MQFSKKALLALEAVVDIAFYSRPDPVQSKDITKRQGIPQRYLEQVMQHLVRAGILKGVRGPRGGYRLARERRRISVGDVVRVVNNMENEDDAKGGTRSTLGTQVVRPMIEVLEREFMAQLDRLTIEDLCRKADQCGVGTDPRSKADFTI